MISNSFKRIDRFFRAKSVVFIGGKDIFVPIRELKRRGFKGKIFVVNPSREKIYNYKYSYRPYKYFSKVNIEAIKSQFEL